PLDILRGESPATQSESEQGRLARPTESLIQTTLKGNSVPPTPLPPVAPSPAAVGQLAELLQGWQRPLILAGGGVIAANAENVLAQVAERLGAPVLTTLMGKCAIRSDHPLAAGLVWHQATQDVSNMEEFFSPLFQRADGVVAVGCRFTQASTGSWKL